MTVPPQMITALAAYSFTKKTPPAVVEEALGNLKWLLNDSPLEPELRYLPSRGDQQAIRIRLTQSATAECDFLVIGERKHALKVEATSRTAPRMRSKQEQLVRLSANLGARMEGLDSGKLRIYLAPVADADDRLVLRDALRRFVMLAMPSGVLTPSPGSEPDRKSPAHLPSSAASPASRTSDSNDSPPTTLRVDDALTVDDNDIDMTSSAQEGRATLRLHLSRERSRSLRARKLHQVLSCNSTLACEVCAFDFSDHFPTIGAGFCEVHHLKPVATLTVEDSNVSLADLAIVCPNCHRMLHQQTPPFSMSELRIRRADPSSSLS